MSSLPPSITILIIDDDENILEILGEAFKQYGLNVIKAKNGLDGWHLFKSQEPEIILTDIWMPGIDGEELSYRIRNHSPKAIIGLMTGGDTDMGMKLLNSGIANYFFRKPFAISYVCKSLIENSRPHEPSHEPAIEEYNHGWINYFK